MEIAVLSGKGGTGKTFISTNLAWSLDKANYVDCDIEEPNGHIFLKAEILDKELVNVEVPEVNMDKCTGCRTCVDFCKFNALSYVGDKLLVFEDMCHSCGGCSLLCPEKALTNRERSIGRIEIGRADNVNVYSGFLNIGEPSGTQIIEDLLLKTKESSYPTIVDSPPGTACIVMDSIKTADFCLIVAEPTSFGLHNIEMVYDLVKLFNKPMGLVINKSFGENTLIEDFAREKNIPIFLDIPYDKKLAKISSDGELIAKVDQDYKRIFQDLYKKIRGYLNETAIDS